MRIYTQSKGKCIRINCFVIFSPSIEYWRGTATIHFFSKALFSKSYALIPSICNEPDSISALSDKRSLWALSHCQKRGCPSWNPTREGFLTKRQGVPLFRSRFLLNAVRNETKCDSAIKFEYTIRNSSFVWRKSELLGMWGWRLPSNHHPRSSYSSLFRLTQLLSKSREVGYPSSFSARIQPFSWLFLESVILVCWIPKEGRSGTSISILHGTKEAIESWVSKRKGRCQVCLIATRFLFDYFVVLICRDQKRSSRSSRTSWSLPVLYNALLLR